jgi:D-arabinose 1-dehydrogenase-like Zn-dependent alcohol dehydrogenase
VHVCRNRARVQAGDRVVVIGAGGGVGIHMAQMAKVCGAEVAGIERTEAKLEALADLGVIPVSCGPVLDVDPTRLFGSALPTVIIDMVGLPATLEWAVRSIDGGGRILLLTTFPDRTIALNPRDTVFRESSIIGSRYCSPAELQEAAALVASGAIRPIVGAVVGPGELLGLHARLREGTLLGRGALDWRGTDRNLHE